jgi:hypothetical protein
MIPKYMSDNFKTLKKAFDNEAACLLEVKDKDGKYVYVICAHNHLDDVDDGKTEELVPFGRMFTIKDGDDPYELYTFPDEEEDNSSKGTV